MSAENSMGTGYSAHVASTTEQDKGGVKFSELFYNKDGENLNSVSHPMG